MILGLSDIKDWLKKLDIKSHSIANHFYIGKLDNKKEKSIGVYQLKSSSTANIALGGLDNTKTKEKSVSILIHWNKNAKETEEKSYEIYNNLIRQKEFMINNVKVNYIKLLSNEPIDVGTDSSNVYERVIQATFYYENKEVK